MRRISRGVVIGTSLICFGLFISDPAASALWLAVSGLLVSIGIAI